MLGSISQFVWMISVRKSGMNLMPGYGYDTSLPQCFHSLFSFYGQTSAMLVKETLAARQNTSPTVHYEVSQLYSAGALKIACVGLQCVGFNSGLYHTIVEQAAKCRQSGRWKSGWGGSDFSTIDGSDSIRNNGTSNLNENAYSTSLFNFM